MSSTRSEPTRDRWWRWTGICAALALVCAAAVWGTWRLFVDTVHGQQVDELAYIGGFIGASHVTEHAFALLGTISVGAVALAMVVVGLIAALRRRWLLALEAVAVVAASNVSTQVLKYHLFHRPSLLPWQETVTNNSLPSGHTTAAASAAVALVLVVPPRWRTLTAAVGAVVMFAFGYATLAGHWHRPSDVLAGYLVCLAWGFAALAVTAGKRALWGAHHRELDATVDRLGWLRLFADVLGVALCVAAVVVAPRHLEFVNGWWQPRSPRLHAYAASCLAYAGVSLVVMSVLASTITRLDASPRGRRPSDS